MNWHSDDTWLDEYVDSKERRSGVPGDAVERRSGVPGDAVKRRSGVPADAARMVEAHLASCERCRALATDLQAIRSMSRSLEPQVPPPHVWGRIASVIDREAPARHAEARSWSMFSLSTFGLQQAAALAMTFVLGTGLWWVGARLAPAPTTDFAADLQTPVMTAGVGSVPLQMAEAQFTTAIAGLEQLTSVEQGALDPDTTQVVRANLSVIDAAIDESRAVLKTEPESQVAQQSLFEALRSKVALLQDVLALINEMRKGDPDATARIVSGLNP